MLNKKYILVRGYSLLEKLIVGQEDARESKAGIVVKGLS